MIKCVHNVWKNEARSEIKVPLELIAEPQHEVGITKKEKQTVSPLCISFPFLGFIAETLCEQNN